MSTFKTPRQRNVGKSARSGLVNRQPPMPDSNPWRTLLKKRRGYHFAVKVLHRCISLFWKKGSKDVFAGDQTLPVQNQALVLLFRGEQENVYRAAETRRGCPAYTIKEEQGVIFQQGRKLDPGSDVSPSVAKQDQHVILVSQVSSFCVPVLSPNTALGRSVCESVHDSFHGDSAASAQARSSRF